MIFPNIIGYLLCRWTTTIEKPPLWGLNLEIELQISKTRTTLWNFNSLRYQNRTDCQHQKTYRYANTSSQSYGESTRDSADSSWRTLYNKKASFPWNGSYRDFQSRKIRCLHSYDLYFWFRCIFWTGWKDILQWIKSTTTSTPIQMRWELLISKEQLTKSQEFITFDTQSNQNSEEHSNRLSGSGTFSHREVFILKWNWYYRNYFYSGAGKAILKQFYGLG